MPSANPDAPEPARHAHRWVIASCALAGVVIAWLNTRGGMLRTPDSISYLSTARNLRHGRGIVDFTGEPIAVFPPVYPALLAIGDGTLGWARGVQMVAFGALAGWTACLLGRRTGHPVIAGVGALAVVCTPGMLAVGRAMWSETLYVALAVAALAVLADRRAEPGDVTDVTDVTRSLATRSAVTGGVLTAAAVLTRYVGIAFGLAATVLVLLRVWRARRWRPFLAFATAAGLPVAIWLVRNVVATGRMTGPRIHGITDRRATVLTRPAEAIGGLFIGIEAAQTARLILGWLVIVAVAATVAGLGRRMSRGRSVVPLDAAMATWVAANAFVVVVSRLTVSSDVDFRMMSPIVVPVVYAVAVAASEIRLRSLGHSRSGPTGVLAASLTAAVLTSAVGLVDAGRAVPRLRSGLARPDPAAALLDAARAVGRDTHLITNDPWRLWDRTGRQPITFGFVPITPGQAIMPLDQRGLADLACAGSSALVWFDYTVYTIGATPAQAAPELAQIVTLSPTTVIPGADPFATGTIYTITPRAGTCDGPT